MIDSQGNLIDSLSSMKDTILDLVLLCLFFAVLVLMLVEFFKYLMKPYLTKSTFYNWLEQLGLSDQEKEEFVDIMGFRSSNSFFITSWNTLYRLSHKLFMKQVENATYLVFASAAKHGSILSHISKGVSGEQLNYVFYKQEQGDIDGETETEKVSEAYDAVNQAISKNLDQLQMLLSLRWVSIIRATAISTGIAIASLAYYLLPDNLSGLEDKQKQILVVMAIVITGATSGYFSSVLYDLLKRIVGRSGNG